MKYFYLTLISLMAVSCLKNQPISFNDNFECYPCTDTSYCLPASIDDTTQAQFVLTPLSTNMLSNGTFSTSDGWTFVGSGWTIADGMAIFAGTSGQMYRDTDIPLIGGYYRLSFDIPEDALTATLDMTIEIGGVNVFTLTGQPNEQEVNLFFYLDSPSNNTINFIGIDGNMTMDNLSLVKMSEVIFDIKNCESEEVVYSETDGSSVTYYEQSSVNFSARHVNYSFLQPYGTAVISLAWQNYVLADGCYCICIKDVGLLGFDHIKNGIFSSDSFWTITNAGTLGWAIASGYAEHSSGGVETGNDVLSQTLASPLSEDSDYTLRFSVAFGTGSGNADVSILYDTATLTNQLLDTFTVSGPGFLNYLISGIPITKLKFAADNAGLRKVRIDEVSILEKEETLACVCTSKCISLREDWDSFAAARKMCAIEIEGANSNSAFGFRFSNPAFTLKGRVFGMIRNSKYPSTEFVTFKDLTGLKSLQYAESEKTKELQIFDVPEYVHDWLRIALECQTVNITINGVTKQYIKAGGDYIPNWRKTSINAPAIVEIQEIQQLAPNAKNV